ncbi:hypothetical protein QTP88_013093 [Uroleucon formosanum]
MEINNKLPMPPKRNDNPSRSIVMRGGVRVVVVVAVGGGSRYSPFSNRRNLVGVRVCTGTEVIAALVQWYGLRCCLRFRSGRSAARSRYDNWTSSNCARHYRQPTVETTSCLTVVSVATNQGTCGDKFSRPCQN